MLYNDYQNQQVSQQKHRHLRVAFNTSLCVFFSTTAARELLVQST
jgi:hypothetical protein